MPVNNVPGHTFGLLPEPERGATPFFISALLNALILLLAIVIGISAKHAIVEHHYEQTLLIVPQKEPPAPPKIKIVPPKMPDPPKIDVKLEAPKIEMPKPEPKPELKPIQMEAKLNMPIIKAAKPNVIEAPQPKAALTAAMPAQDNHVKASTAPVHLGQTFGLTPNPNATRPATVAAIGNQFGGMQGPAVAPHGVVGSTGIGNGTKFGSNAGVVGKVASAGIPGNAVAAQQTTQGKVASVGIPAATAALPVQRAATAVTTTNLEVYSKPPVQYTPEAKQLRVQGDVILRVTFKATGQVVVNGVVHGLGHGLDEEAQRVAQQIRFHPATRNGQAVDLTTNITITFQLA